MKCDELQSTQIYARFATEVYDDFGDSNQEQEYYRKEHADAAIAELKEVYKESVDVKVKILERCKKAEDELRNTQRALWLARAERAKEMCQRLLIQGFDPKWEEVERKCRAKAEEYK